MKSDKLTQVMSLESTWAEDSKFENVKKKLLVWSYRQVSLPDIWSTLLISARSYISRCEHNSPKAATKLSSVELHCGKWRSVVLKRKKNAWSKNDNNSGSAALIYSNDPL